MPYPLQTADKPGPTPFVTGLGQGAQRTKRWWPLTGTEGDAKGPVRWHSTAGRPLEASLSCTGVPVASCFLPTPVGNGRRWLQYVGPQHPRRSQWSSGSCPLVVGIWGVPDGRSLSPSLSLHRPTFQVSVIKGQKAWPRWLGWHS